MASIKTAIQLYDGVSKPMVKIRNSMDQTIGRFEQIERNMRITGDTMSEVKSKVTSYAHELKKTKNMNFGDAMREAWRNVDRDTMKAIESQKQYNNEVNKSSGLMNKLKNAAIAVGAAFTARQVINLSDNVTLTTARLDLMNDGLQTTAELQNMIFHSAQRSRTAYMDTAAAVSKLGILAKDAFSSNEEMIAFAELMNKQFKIGGASIQEQTSAMYQLTQAMAAGKLQGDEFRSIMENAPLLAQAIADEMGKTVGELREMSSEGLITADVIKNAMFNAADQTNAKFEQLPMTFGQVGTVIGNMLLQTFQPVIQMIGTGAQFIYDNWSIIEPVFWGLIAAVGAYTVAVGIMKAVTIAQTIAQMGLNAALMANPAMWIALAIGVLIGMIYKWVQSVGGLKVAWLIVMNAILTAWDWVQIGFFTGIYWIIDLWDKMKLKLATVSVNIANFMGDMKVNVLTILQNMVNGAIGLLNDLINAANQIPGVSIGLIGEVTFATDATIQNEAEKQAREAGLEAYKSEIEANMADRDAALVQMQNDAIAATATRQAEIDAAQAEALAKKDDPASFDYDSMVNNIEDTAGNTAKMADSMDSSDETLKYMRDLAEQEVINRFTTAEIKVEMNNQNTVASEMDLDGMVTYLEDKLYETMVVAAEGVHD